MINDSCYSWLAIIISFNLLHGWVLGPTILKTALQLKDIVQHIVKTLQRIGVNRIIKLIKMS